MYCNDVSVVMSINHKLMRIAMLFLDFFISTVYINLAYRSIHYLYSSSCYAVVVMYWQ
jgi:hypothetical protein